MTTQPSHAGSRPRTRAPHTQTPTHYPAHAFLTGRLNLSVFGSWGLRDRFTVWTLTQDSTFPESLAWLVAPAPRPQGGSAGALAGAWPAGSSASRGPAGLPGPWPPCRGPLGALFTAVPSVAWLLCKPGSICPAQAKPGSELRSETPGSHPESRLVALRAPERGPGKARTQGSRGPLGVGCGFGGMWPRFPAAQLWVLGRRWAWGAVAQGSAPAFLPSGLANHGQTRHMVRGTHLHTLRRQPRQALRRSSPPPPTAGPEVGCALGSPRPSEGPLPAGVAESAPGVSGLTAPASPHRDQAGTSCSTGRRTPPRCASSAGAPCPPSSGGG